MRRVVIVGATDGLGRALAAEYASRGFWVALVGRDATKLQRVAGDLSSRFPTATLAPVVCDLRDRSRLEPAFREAIGAIGHCDLFLHVAGVMFPTDGETSVAAEDAETLDVNTTAAVVMLGLAANYFRLAGRGQIAAISSIAGDRGRKGNPAYTASKAALSAYLEALRNRLAAHGVTVSTVKPGFVATRMAGGRKGVFWAAPPEEAARIIADRLEKGHEVFYVYRRWGLVASVLKTMPRFLFKRVGPA